MNETNRFAIVLLAAVWIILMAVVIFLTWAAAPESLDRLGDMVAFMEDHQDNASKLILTLGAMVLIVLALLVIIVELAPEEQALELKVEQAGATTIIPADIVRGRLEEALVTLPQVTAAHVRMVSRDKAVGVTLELTVTPETNLAAVTQEASRVVAETLQTDLGLPLETHPTVRITFGGPKAQPVASSAVQPPEEGEPAAPEGTPPAAPSEEPAQPPPTSEGPASEDRP